MINLTQAEIYLDDKKVCVVTPLMDNTVRGNNSERLYISDDYYVCDIVKGAIDFLEEAKKYCNHSKKKQMIENKLKFWNQFLLSK